MDPTSAYPVYPCGDQALTIELGNCIDMRVNEKVISLFTYLRSLEKAGIKDMIPSYHSLTVVYDLAFFQETVKGSVYAHVCEWLLAMIPKATEAALSPRKISIPVCYDPSVGWDIELIASGNHLSVEEVIGIHTATVYRVYLIGFLPGFSYMGKVDERIVTPRKTSPRTMVPKGSVGIAGEQTGIYPFDSPGGWQIIGQTPVMLFNASAQQPCYLRPGDEVVFHRIDLETFKSMKHGHTHP